LPLLLGIGSLSGGGSDSMDMVHGLFGLGAVATACFAFPVFCALALRSPTSGQWMRWIYAHGRWLLVAAAVIDAVLALKGVSLDSAESADGRFGAVLLGVVFDAYIFGYLLVSRRVRDVFSDFPLAVA
jgi:hypothetical protein